MNERPRALSSSETSWTAPQALSCATPTVPAARCVECRPGA
jgi:hypothetical protein